jgi:small-conductance mechanosensitive channel
MVGTMHGAPAGTRHDETGQANPPARRSGGRSGHHRANTGSWIAALLIIMGCSVGVFALASHLMALWIVTGVILVAGGVTALTSRIMDQAY